MSLDRGSGCLRARGGGLVEVWEVSVEGEREYDCKEDGGEMRHDREASRESGLL